MREKSQEEIKKFMDEAAMAKAKYKEKKEIKFNIDNIVKKYEKTSKIDENVINWRANKNRRKYIIPIP